MTPLAAENLQSTHGRGIYLINQLMDEVSFERNGAKAVAASAAASVSGRETEDYAVDLSNVTLLDLIIEPDKENGKARASLLSLRLALPFVAGGCLQSKAILAVLGAVAARRPFPAK